MNQKSPSFPAVFVYILTILVALALIGCLKPSHKPIDELEGEAEETKEEFDTAAHLSRETAERVFLDWFHKRFSENGHPYRIEGTVLSKHLSEEEGSGAFLLVIKPWDDSKVQFTCQFPKSHQEFVLGSEIGTRVMLAGKIEIIRRSQVDVIGAIPITEPVAEPDSGTFGNESIPVDQDGDELSMAAADAAFLDWFHGGSLVQRTFTVTGIVRSKEVKIGEDQSVLKLEVSPWGNDSPVIINASFPEEGESIVASAQQAREISFKGRITGIDQGKISMEGFPAEPGALGLK